MTLSSGTEGPTCAGSHQVVDEVGEGPDDRDAHKGDAQQHDVKEPDGQHI